MKICKDRTSFQIKKRLSLKIKYADSIPRSYNKVNIVIKKVSRIYPYPIHTKALHFGLGT